MPNWNDETLKHARRIVEHLGGKNALSEIEKELYASSKAVEAVRRERIEKLLDGAAAGIEHARVALSEALSLAKTDDGRAALRNAIAVLALVSDDARASHSSGDMCAAYEAEVRS